MFTTKLIIEGRRTWPSVAGSVSRMGPARSTFPISGCSTAPWPDREHNHLINIGIAGQTSGVTDIVVRNVYCGQSVGDGINIQVRRVQ